MKNKSGIDSDFSSVYRSKLPFQSAASDGDVILAVGNISMNSLLKFDFPQTKIVQCHSTDHYTKQTFRYTNFDWDNITVNKVNLITIDNIATDNSLPEHNLLKLSTNLLIESQLLAFPIVTFAPEINPTYARCYFILYRKIDAYKLIETILKRNRQDVTNGDLITGFVIEDDYCVICFFEGITQGFISNIIYFIKSKIENGKLFYNSDLIFEKRLYGSFVSTNGVYEVVLKGLLQDILSKQLVYVRFNLPILCLQVRTLQSNALIKTVKNFRQ